MFFPRQKILLIRTSLKWRRLGTQITRAALSETGLLQMPSSPSHDTFNRLFAALDPPRFLEAFMRWTQSLRTTLADEVVAIDGRESAAPSAGRRREPQSHRQRVGLGQRARPWPAGQRRRALANYRRARTAAHLRTGRPPFGSAQGLELVETASSPSTPRAASAASPAKSPTPTPTTCSPSKATKALRTPKFGDC